MRQYPWSLADSTFMFVYADPPFDLGYVYVMGVEGRRLYKIGRAKGPHKRRKYAQRQHARLTGKGRRAYVAVTIPVRYGQMHMLEKYPHRRYANRRVWPDREWFRLTLANLKKAAGLRREHG